MEISKKNNMNNLPQSVFNESFGDAGYRLFGIYKTGGLEHFLNSLTQSDFNKIIESIKEYYYTQGYESES